MEGDIAVCAADRYNALTYRDEVHAVGMYGARGGGISERDEVAHRIHAPRGDAGQGIRRDGGHLAADPTIVDVIRSYARWGPLHVLADGGCGRACWLACGI